MCMKDAFYLKVKITSAKKCWYSEQKKQLLSEQAVPSLNDNDNDALLCDIAAQCLFTMRALYTTARLQFTGVEIVLKLESPKILSASFSAELGLKTKELVHH